MNKNMSEESHKKIFISHSSKDKQIVDIFVDKLLHLGLQIDPNDVAYTSREETEIRIWFRRFFNKANTFNWVALNEIIGRDIFNEEDSERKFRDFITRTIRENPGCIYIPEKCHIEAVQMELW